MIPTTVVTTAEALDRLHYDYITSNGKVIFIAMVERSDDDDMMMMKFRIPVKFSKYIFFFAHSKISFLLLTPLYHKYAKVGHKISHAI